VNASFDKASSDNERNALILELDDGTGISCVQVAGLIARRILCYVKSGDRLARGQRYGFIRFGSRVDVYLPAGSTPRVAIGDKVKASSTVLAELPRR
jgi:phosphatidylserine decarboxylase